MLKDYKITGIVRAGGIATVSTVFYSGDITSEMEMGIDSFGVSKESLITRYRRDGIIGKKTLRIKEPITDAEIMKILSDQLSKVDTTKVVIPQQITSKPSSTLRAKILQ